MTRVVPEVVDLVHVTRASSLALHRFSDFLSRHPTNLRGLCDSLVTRKLFFLKKTLFVPKHKLKFRKYRLVPKRPAQRLLDQDLITRTRNFLESALGFRVVDQKDKWLVLVQPGAKAALLRSVLLYLSLVHRRKSAELGSDAQLRGTLSDSRALLYLDRLDAKLKTGRLAQVHPSMRVSAQYKTFFEPKSKGAVAV